uniref:Sensor histidine kinase ZraS n=1 Tax=Desulfovibrio sp. U5L TaxID=596152 RepID=I2PWY9_9BACT
MQTQSRSGPRFLAHIPPWLYLGSVVILAVVMAVMTTRNTHRENALTGQTLFEKGTAFIRAFEAGARLGLGMHWRGEQFQALLEETARQPGVLRLVVTDADGRILAHSDKTMIGQHLYDPQTMAALGVAAREKWRITTLPDGRKAFEVYRAFEPGLGRAVADGCDDEAEGSACPWSGSEAASGTRRQVIFADSDLAPYEAALAQDTRNTVVLAVILFLLGVGGVLTLFWAQSSRLSRRQLKDTQAFATEIVNNLPVGLLTTSSNGRLAVVNGAAERIAGFKAADVVGKLPQEVLPPAWCGLQEVIDAGEPVAERETECSFDGEKSLPLSVSASRIVNEEGAYLGNIYIFRDLGEVRRLQEEVRRREKLAALGGLAAGVAHEIRNPLSSIKGVAKYFEGHFDAGSEGRELAGVMAREVDRLNRVITELLDFARPSDVTTRPTDLAELVERSLRLIGPDAAAHHVRVAFAHDGTLPKVAVDPDRFAQILLNLCLNAVQAMEDGGLLSVRTVHEAARGRVRIDVEDTGRGIPAASLGSIFNPYFTTKPSGTGLGLAIVQKLVEAHQGEIQVKSTPGRGSVFSIFLPVRA